MELPIYQVDAFTDNVFTGNPAAVVPLDSWPDDETLLKIAAENNLSETAFFVPKDGGYHIRWFTPTTEVDLCGHATLASAHILYTELGYKEDAIYFHSMSGKLIVARTNSGYELDFPVWPSEKSDPPVDARLKEAFGTECSELYKGKKWVCVFENPAFIRAAVPDINAIAKITECQGVIITAKGDNGYDCVSRYFGPQIGIDEDPVTGSAHCLLAPIWADKLGKNTIRAYQASARGGELLCTLENDRVKIGGQAALYLKGKIFIPD